MSTETQERERPELRAIDELQSILLGPRLRFLRGHPAAELTTALDHIQRARRMIASEQPR